MLILWLVPAGMLLLAPAYGWLLVRSLKRQDRAALRRAARSRM